MMKDSTGKEKTPYEKMRDEIDKAHEGIPNPEDLNKIMQGVMDSIDIVVPIQVSISLENVSALPFPEIKLIELPSKKQIEYERMAFQLETNSVDGLQKIQDGQTLDAMIDFEKAELEDLYKMVILICDNGLNLDENKQNFVTQEFCENYLSKTMLYNILVTYMKKFTSQALLQRMKLINFFAMPVMLSNQHRQKSSGETG